MFWGYRGVFKFITYAQLECGERTRYSTLTREGYDYDISTAFAVKTLGAGGTGYFSLLKPKALSENEASELDETLTGCRIFGAAALVHVSVVTRTVHGTVVRMRALSWVSAVTPSGPSRVWRR